MAGVGVATFQPKINLALPSKDNFSFSLKLSFGLYRQWERNAKNQNFESEMGFQE